MTRSIQLTALMLSSILLSACSVVERTPALAQRDDDGYCRANGGEQGSKAYAECLKSRDTASAQSSRLDRSHLRMSEDMLNRR